LSVAAAVVVDLFRFVAVPFSMAVTVSSIDFVMSSMSSFTDLGQ
jgi:hypothetical protein